MKLYSAIACAFAALWMLASPRIGAGQEAPVRVVIDGIEGELQENARHFLSLTEAADGITLTSERVEALHAAAPAEIVRALQPFGYYRPEIRSSLSRTDSMWVARYSVAPGPPIRLSDVDVRVRGEGEDEPRFRHAATGFPLQDGDVLEHGTYESGKAEFSAIAAELGYFEAAFDTARILIDLDEYDARILMRFQTGPRYAFGDLRFRQDILDTAIVRSYSPFKPGDPFSVDALLELQTNLTESPYFTRAEVVSHHEATRNTRVPVEVTLKPQKRFRYEIGAGYGTDTGFRGRGMVEVRRINRLGHRAQTELKLSQIERSISGRYLIPRTYPSSAVLTLFAGYSDLEPTTSSSDRLIFGTSLQSALGRWLNELALTYEYDSFEVGADTGTSSLLMLDVALARTSGAEPTFTENGYEIRSELRGSHDALLSSAGFAQISLRGKLIRTLAPRLRLITRIDGGATATREFRKLPPSIRFFAGGDLSVRGYEYRSLGEEDAAGNVIGGKHLLVASAELEYRFLPSWGVAAFYDAGNAFIEFPPSLERGAGTGIRWLSPIGQVRIDGAFAVSDPDTGFRLHFRVGPDL